MSTTSKEVMQKDDNLVECSIIPKWVDSFLEKTFFVKCSSHDMKKNDLNRYCITCDASACKYCIMRDSHKDHQILTIYRHVYQNVVPLSQMETHMDCDKIQPYKCNKKWVISLTPLIHKGSGLLIGGNRACNVCKRKLYDPDCFRFCSIICKVQSTYGTRTNQLPEQQDVGTSRPRGSAENPSKRKRSRKGVPYRAPLF